jgi:hypothetical protein
MTRRDFLGGAITGLFTAIIGGISALAGYKHRGVANGKQTKAIKDAWDEGARTVTGNYMQERNILRYDETTRRATLVALQSHPTPPRLGWTCEGILTKPDGTQVPVSGIICGIDYKSKRMTWKIPRQLYDEDYINEPLTETEKVNIIAGHIQHEEVQL